MRKRGRLKTEMKNEYMNEFGIKTVCLVPHRALCTQMSVRGMNEGRERKGDEREGGREGGSVGIKWMRMRPNLFRWHLHTEDRSWNLQEKKVKQTQLNSFNTSVSANYRSSVGVKTTKCWLIATITVCSRGMMSIFHARRSNTATETVCACVVDVRNLCE